MQKERSEKVSNQTRITEPRSVLPHNYSSIGGRGLDFDPEQNLIKEERRGITAVKASGRNKEV